jgi:flagellar hook-associated protein 1 FlgK
MAHLLSLQNAYAANARVMSTVNQMYQTLMQAI